MIINSFFGKSVCFSNKI